MSDSEYVPFSDPRRVVADGRLAKQERRERLGRIFAPQPEPADDEVVVNQFIDAVAARVVERVQAAQPEVEPKEPAPARGGFDGGARTTLPLPPESHGETLVRILRSRAADRGAAF